MKNSCTPPSDEAFRSIFQVAGCLTSNRMSEGRKQGQHELINSIQPKITFYLVWQLFFSWRLSSLSSWQLSLTSSWRLSLTSSWRLSSTSSWRLSSTSSWQPSFLSSFCRYQRQQPSLLSIFRWFRYEESSWFSSSVGVKFRYSVDE